VTSPPRGRCEASSNFAPGPGREAPVASQTPPGNLTAAHCPFWHRGSYSFVPTQPATGQRGLGPHSRARCPSSRSRNCRLMGSEQPHCSRQQLPSLRQVMTQSASTRHPRISVASRPSGGGTRRSESAPVAEDCGGAPGRWRGADVSPPAEALGGAGAAPRPACGSGPPFDDPFRQDVEWLASAITAEKARTL
jgi:hypothetical protein